MLRVRLCGQNIIQFEYTRALYHLVSFTFGVYCEVPFTRAVIGTETTPQQWNAACGLFKKWKIIFVK